MPPSNTTTMTRETLRQPEHSKADSLQSIEILSETIKTPPVVLPFVKSDSGPAQPTSVEALDVSQTNATTIQWVEEQTGSSTTCSNTAPINPEEFEALKPPGAEHDASGKSSTVGKDSSNGDTVAAPQTAGSMEKKCDSVRSEIDSDAEDNVSVVSDGTDLRATEQLDPCPRLDRVNPYDVPKDYTTHEEYIKEFEKRKGKATKRLRQHRDYDILLEQRLRFVENELRNLLNANKKSNAVNVETGSTAEKGNEPGPEPQPEPQPEPEPEPDSVLGQATICKVLNLTWSEFKQLRKSRKDGTVLYSIEILLEEPVIEYITPVWASKGHIHSRNLNSTNDIIDLLRDSNWQGSDDLDRTAESENLAGNFAPQCTKDSDHSVVPERMRINSPLLLRILDKLRGFTEVRADKPYSVMRPFRTLLHFQEDLKRWKTKVTAKLELQSKGQPALENHGAPTTQTILTGGANAETRIEDGEPEEETSDYYPPGTDSKEAVDNLECLLSVIEKIRAHEASVQTSSTVAYNDLWYLFKPGEVVLASAEPLQAYQIIQVTGVRHLPTYTNAPHNQVRGSTTTIHCKYMDAIGKQIGAVDEIFSIPRFSGRQSVKSLPVYPLLNPAVSATTRSNLIERGKRFLGMLSIRHVQSKGAITTLETKEIVESQIVVDFEQALQYHTKWAPEVGEISTDSSSQTVKLIEEKFVPCTIDECCTKGSDSFVIDLCYDNMRNKEVARRYMGGMLSTRALDEKETITDDELILFNSRVFGFILRSRKWGKFYIDDLTDIQPRTLAFNGREGLDRLVLPDNHATTIESLVQQHFALRDSKNPETEQMDIVRGKGKGLIILLHGAPGVGKTSTAELVAEKFAKPLFPITCGDLGVTPSEVESKLELSFTLAHRWGCILLIDEADIFLSERTKEDFLRNSLVSVFLRVLEYYSGILFLTTNRVGSLDEAFKSRIHLSLYYPPLGMEATKTIWTMNLTWLQANRKKMTIQKEEILKFVDENFFIDEHANSAKHPRSRKRDPSIKASVAPWNGRQIRNAFQTAIALAENEAQKTEDRTILRPRHFETVVQASIQFDKYMYRIYSKSDGRRAFEASLRNDRYGAEDEPDRYHRPAEYEQHQQRSHRDRDHPLPLRRQGTGGYYRDQRQSGPYYQAREDYHHHEGRSNSSYRHPGSRPHRRPHPDDFEYDEYENFDDGRDHRDDGSHLGSPHSGSDGEDFEDAGRIAPGNEDEEPYERAPIKEDRTRRPDNSRGHGRERATSRSADNRPERSRGGAGPGPGSSRQTRPRP
ncbi:hypothetical protein BJ508DRAFT_306780 [Ascobolus immersus RN42]|uniref:AAA+ ATPase domain-containing protein n=1 Tax=Ascobolus immersus RN42 TaxID=1160509 RepID=A0A3N4I730_ASCIM|nr:hypothetical protein BJ508DRAFT_306780 [Ascobolus immersus RN42]